MPETKNLPKIPMVTEKSQARLSSALLESDSSAAIACDRGEKHQYTRTKKWVSR
jgi:hypothetical protein